MIRSPAGVRPRGSCDPRGGLGRLEVPRQSSTVSLAGPSAHHAGTGASSSPRAQAALRITTFPFAEVFAVFLRPALMTSLIRAPRAEGYKSRYSWGVAREAVASGKGPAAERAMFRVSGFSLLHHETRDTRHESRPFSDTKFETGPFGTEGLQSFFWPGDRFRLKVMTPLSGTKTLSAPAAHAARSLLSCALWSGMGGILSPEPLSSHRPRRQHGLLGFHESRNMFFPCPPATPRRATPSPANGFFTKHETRNTNHGFFPTRSSKQGPLVLKGFSLFFGRGTGLG